MNFLTRLGIQISPENSFFHCYWVLEHYNNWERFEHIHVPVHGVTVMRGESEAPPSEH